MRYSEIIEGEYADKAARASKKLAARIRKVDSARKKKSNAAHKYQDDMRAANDSLRT